MQHMHIWLGQAQALVVDAIESLEFSDAWNQSLLLTFHLQAQGDDEICVFDSRLKAGMYCRAERVEEFRNKCGWSGHVYIDAKLLQ